MSPKFPAFTSDEVVKVLKKQVLNLKNNLEAAMQFTTEQKIRDVLTCQFIMEKS